LGCLGRGFHEFKNLGTVLLLVTGVEVGIVGLMGLDHFPNDFQQALAETTQGAGMTFAFRAFLPVINFRPRTD
jgi:hypothetical protein